MKKNNCGKPLATHHIIYMPKPCPFTAFLVAREGFEPTTSWL